MKRGLLYITIFLLICGAIWWLSGAMDHFIMNWYMVDIKSELDEVFESKDTLYIDGTMLSIYLYHSMKTFEINGVRHNYFEKDNQYDAIKKKVYRVEIVEGESYLKIQENSSKPILKLNSILEMDKVMMWRKIITNVITIMIGIVLLFLYERKHFFRIEKDTFKEIPV